MFSLVGDIQEAWRRASYADYPSLGTQNVRNKLATRSRLFIEELNGVKNQIESRAASTEQSNLSQANQTYLYAGYFVRNTGVCALFETLFYLPNLFRQKILVNSSYMSFVNRNDALLDLMNVIFRINMGQNAPIQEFRFQNFLSCYRPFFTQTLPYECLSLSLRYSIYGQISKSKIVNEMSFGGNIISGAIAGAIGQVFTHGLFLKNLRSQNSFQETKIRFTDRLGWVTLRGALLGMCHLSVYNTVLEFIEQPLDPFGTRAQNVDVLTKQFIFNSSAPSIENATDGDRILAKLCLLGNFDQRKDDNAITNINQIERRSNKNLLMNVLIATIVSSAAIALIVTPFDMVFFKMIAKTANMTSKASFAEVANDIYVKNWTARGSGNALLLSSLATFVRYLFVLTTFNSYDNVYG